MNARKTVAAALLTALVAGGGAVLFTGLAPLAPATRKAVPAPKPLTPVPAPAPKPCPPNRPCPRVKLPAVGGCCDSCRCERESCSCELPCLSAGASVGGRDASLSADLPLDLHAKNAGGSDGAGLCVFCSMRHAGEWQNDTAFYMIFDWMKKHPGGGYPEKVDRMVAQLCQEMALPTPKYLQVQGNVKEALIAACATGRAVCGTYSRSPTGRYGGARIAHMVSYMKADPNEGPTAVAVMDNNYPGTYEYMSWREWERVGCNWLIINLNPPAAPPPHNPK